MSSDLVGKQFGQLTVIELRGKAGRYNLWACRCSCGRVEVLPQYRLTQKSRQLTTCTVCNRGPCIICGGAIEWDRPQTNVCSELCQQEKRRRSHLDSYYRRKERDPDLNRRRWRHLKAKLEEDPVRAEEYRERTKLSRHASYERLKQDPEWREKTAQVAAERYRQNREAIIERRTARWQLLNEEEKAAILARNREKQREWRRRWRDELERNPEQKAAYLAYLRELRAKRALEQLTQSFEEFIDDSGL